jgi:hypothetical protein
MTRAYQWLTVATAIAMLALGLGFAAFLLGPERVAIPHDAEPVWIAVGAFHAILGLLAAIQLVRLLIAVRRGRRLAADNGAPALLRQRARLTAKRRSDLQPAAGPLAVLTHLCGLD